MKQEERREATRALIVAVATECFGKAGYEKTTIDNIALKANIAKGAVYHHFRSKRDLFEAVFDAASARLAQTVATTVRTDENVIRTLVSSTEAYFGLCADPAIAQITLRDAPAVLGFERWRELDARHFGGLVSAGLASAMQAGAIERQPVMPLSQMFLASIQAAALACAAQDDFDAAALPYLGSLESILNGLAASKQDHAEQ